MRFNPASPLLLVAELAFVTDAAEIKAAETGFFGPLDVLPMNQVVGAFFPIALVGDDIDDADPPATGESQQSGYVDAVAYGPKNLHPVSEGGVAVEVVPDSMGRHP